MNRPVPAFIGPRRLGLGGPCVCRKVGDNGSRSSPVSSGPNALSSPRANDGLVVLPGRGAAVGEEHDPYARDGEIRGHDAVV